MSSDGIDYPLVVLGNGTMKIQYRTPPPSLGWTLFRIPLTASEGWEIANGSGNPGAPATEDDLKHALGDLKWLALNADWQTGDDKVSLDSVFVMSADVPPPPKSVDSPEPATFAVSAAALGLLALLRKRRKV